MGRGHVLGGRQRFGDADRIGILADPAISPTSCSSNCTSGKRVMPRNCRKLFGSKDWMNTGEPGCGVAEARQGLEHRRFLRQAQRLEMRRMLGLRIHADLRSAAGAGGWRRRQLHDFIEGRHLESAVEGAVRRPQCRQPLARAQGLDLGEREILGEPTRHRFAVDDLGAAPRRELRMLRHIGRAADLVFVPRDEHAVAGHDQIGLDVVGALLDGELVASRVCSGTLAARAAVGDDDYVVGRLSGTEHLAAAFAPSLAYAHSRGSRGGASDTRRARTGCPALATVAARPGTRSSRTPPSRHSFPAPSRGVRSARCCLDPHVPRSVGPRTPLRWQKPRRRHHLLFATVHDVLPSRADVRRVRARIVHQRQVRRVRARIIGQRQRRRVRARIIHHGNPRRVRPGSSISASIGGFEPGSSVSARYGGFEPGSSISARHRRVRARIIGQRQASAGSSPDHRSRAMGPMDGFELPGSSAVRKRHWTLRSRRTKRLDLPSY